MNQIANAFVSYIMIRLIVNLKKNKEYDCNKF